MMFNNVQDVVKWRLCVGCGACFYACKEGCIELIDVRDQGIRPRVKQNCKSCSTCVAACPGVSCAAGNGNESSYNMAGLWLNWGTVLEIWEGHASDPDIRFSGSSGGMVTALSLYCIERGGMSGVVHIGTDLEDPLTNRTYFSRDRTVLLDRTGSRYSPASPCAGLSALEASDHPCAFVGKGCDVAGTRKVVELNPSLKEKLGVAIGIFCAGTPSTAATIELMEDLGVPTNDLTALRYRGRGWPGNFSAATSGRESPTEIPYNQAWSRLQRHRPYRCYLCPDGTAECSDISCGDPWYRRRVEGEQGHSLVLLRTEHGRSLFYKAMESGYVKAERVEPAVLPLSQPDFPAKRGAIWGRISTMKAFRIPVPEYVGWPLYQCWKRLPAGEKAWSILGTAKRIVQRKYYKPSERGNQSTNTVRTR